MNNTTLTDPFYRAGWTAVAVCLTCLSFCKAAEGAPLYRPGREYRTVNTAAYEVTVRKNGRIDVTLPSAEPVIINAHPAVRFDGETRAKPLTVDGRWSARTLTRDALGEGPGVVLRKGNCEWTVQTYVTEPFLIVRVAFINTSRKPVRIAMLSPWTVEADRQSRVSLGAESAQPIILSNGNVSPDTAASDDDVFGIAAHLTAWDPATGRILLAGFLTSERGFTSVRFENDPRKPESLGGLRAECIYDPPVEVSPGGKLVSEALYLAVAEDNVLESLERFGRSLAAANRLRAAQGQMPQAWISSGPGTTVTEQTILEDLDVLDTSLKRYGWNHFLVDDGWQARQNPWEPDADRFPTGLPRLVEEIHARGLVAGLWISPCVVEPDAPMATEHPDWFVAPDPGAAPRVPENALIWDITVPGAADHVRNLFQRIGSEWGFDVVMPGAALFPLMWAERYADPSMTRVEILRKGLQLVREGLGEERFANSFGPMGSSAICAAAWQPGQTTIPIWKAGANGPGYGCVETLTNAARRYYLPLEIKGMNVTRSFLGRTETRPSPGLGDGPPLTQWQGISWVTGATLAGSPVVIGDRLSELTSEDIAVLRRLVPVPGRAARPVDLLDPQGPRIWSLPLASRAGSWHILALFNWDDSAPAVISAPLPAFGLRSDALYTVFGFWEQHYYGTIRGQLAMSTPPAGVRLLGLRLREHHPMLIAVDGHVGQGVFECAALNWDGPQNRLAGTLNAVENTAYSLFVLCPDPYSPKTVETSSGDAQTQQTGDLLQITLNAEKTGPVYWSVTFRKD